MTRRSIVRFFVLMLHREVEKLGEILGDSSKKKSLLVLFIPLFGKISLVSWVFLLGIITVDSVYSHILSK